LDILKRKTAPLKVRFNYILSKIKKITWQYYFVQYNSFHQQGAETRNPTLWKVGQSEVGEVMNRTLAIIIILLVGLLVSLPAY